MFLAGLLAGWRDTSPCTVPHRASHTLIVGLYTLLLVNMLSVKTDFKSFHAISKQLLSFYCVEALWLLCFRDTKINKLLSSVREADTGTDKLQYHRTWYRTWGWAKGSRKPESRICLFLLSFPRLQQNCLRTFLNVRVCLTHSETKCRFGSNSILLW